MRLPMTFIVLCCLTFSHSWADPITKEEAKEWEDRVRRIDGLEPDADLRAISQARLDEALSDIAADPDLPVLYRDLGDAYHSLGHFAEHDHNFDLAIQYHELSLAAYKKSNFARSQESWGDGSEHAYEHIFMNLYDRAFVDEASGNIEKALAGFAEAWAFTVKWHKELQASRLSERFTQRYVPLANRLNTVKYKGKTYQPRLLSSRITCLSTMGAD